MDHLHSHAPAPSHSEHHGSLAIYTSVFVALLILTVFSFGVGNATYLKERAPGAVWAFMMAVSVAKALLVILFFMHLKWEANWKYVLTIPCCIMSVFLVLMLVPDVGRRTFHYAEERWNYAPERATHVYHNAIGHRPAEASATHDTHAEKLGKE